MEKIKVKRVIELLQDCNPEAEFQILMDGQIPFNDIYISCGYKNSNWKDLDIPKLEPKNCDFVILGIESPKE